MELNEEVVKKSLNWLDSLVGNSNDSEIALFTYQLLGILYDTCEELTEELVNCRTDNAKLTEENAYLKHIELEAMRSAANSYKMHNEKLTEENERLTTNLVEQSAENVMLIGENKRLKSEVSVKRKLLDKAEVRIECVEEENNQLKADICNAEMNLGHIIEDSKAKDETITNLIETIKSIQADTVRKMQKRINAHFDSDSDYFRSSHGYIRSVVDQIAKEMLEVVK